MGQPPTNLSNPGHIPEEPIHDQDIRVQQYACTQKTYGLPRLELETARLELTLSIGATQRMFSFPIQLWRYSIDQRARESPRQKVVDRLAKVEAPAGSQDARDFGKESSAVIDMMDASDHDDRVDTLSRKRQLARIGSHERVARRRQTLVSVPEHLHRDVHPNRSREVLAK